MLILVKYHRQLFILDRQLAHMHAISIRGLGMWLARRYQSTRKRLETSLVGLKGCGVLVEELRNEWRNQMETQTQKVPRMYSALNYLVLTVL